MAREGKKRKRYASHHSSKKWYFDACALDKSKQSYALMINPPSGEKAITSHLALGEALGNALEKGPQAKEAFLALLDRLIPEYLEIVGNDGIEKELKYLDFNGFENEMADKIHLATTLREGCNELVTSDGDYSYPKAKLHSLGEHFGICDFCVRKV